MVKAYLSFRQKAILGIISNPNCNIVTHPGGNFVITAALENVNIIDCKTGEISNKLVPSTVDMEADPASKNEMMRVYRPLPNVSSQLPLVTRLAISPSGSLLAVGHFDGTIRIWNFNSGQIFNVLTSGHTGAISALTFSSDENYLFTGSQDTNILVWEVSSATRMARLIGHKNVVTDIISLDNTPRLISSSKDGVVRIWDTNTWTCFQILVDFPGAIWQLAVDPTESWLAAGSIDNFIRFWFLNEESFQLFNIHNNNLIQSLNLSNSSTTEEDTTLTQSNSNSVSVEESSKKSTRSKRPRTLDSKNLSSDLGADLDPELSEEASEQTKGNSFNEKLVYAGRIMRKGITGHGTTARVHTMHIYNNFLVCSSSGNIVEFFKIRTNKEQKSKFKKHVKTILKRKTEVDQSQQLDQLDEQETSQDAAASFDPLILLEPIHFLKLTNEKIRGIAWRHENEFYISTVHNSLISYHYGINPNSNQKSKKQDQNSKILTKVRMVIDSSAHKSEVNQCRLSNDDSLFYSLSSNEIRVWNTNSKTTVRTLSSKLQLSCCLLLEDNVHMIAATKSGTIEVYNILLAKKIQIIENAHAGPITCITHYHGVKSAVSDQHNHFVTGGADAHIRIWSPSKSKSGEMSFTPVKALLLPDQIVSAKCSPKFIAVSMVDSTVNVFYKDSAKLFLNLYGHKLPVSSIDISFDEDIIITGSADKNIKIWGLGFGDCHKSLFAATATITSLVFLPDTHYFLCASFDGDITYWDATTFTRIQTLKGHQGGVTCLDVNSAGTFFISGSEDRSIRYWRQTPEQIFIQEQRQSELEQIFEQEASKEAGFAMGGKTQTLVDLAGRPSLATVKANERLLTLLTTDSDSTTLGSKTLEEHLLNTLEHTRSNDLEQSLLILSWDSAYSLLKYLIHFLETDALQVTLISKCCLFICTAHRNLLENSTNAEIIETLETMQSLLYSKLQTRRDLIGTNVAALRIAQTLKNK